MGIIRLRRRSSPTSCQEHRGARDSRARAWLSCASEMNDRLLSSLLVWWEATLCLCLLTVSESVASVLFCAFARAVREGKIRRSRRWAPLYFGISKISETLRNSQIISSILTCGRPRLRHDAATGAARARLCAAAGDFKDRVASPRRPRAQLAPVAAASGAFGAPAKPAAQAVEVAAMTAALTPHVQPAYRQLADRTRDETRHRCDGGPRRTDV